MIIRYTASIQVEVNNIISNISNTYDADIIDTGSDIVTIGYVDDVLLKLCVDNSIDISIAEISNFNVIGVTDDVEVYIGNYIDIIRDGVSVYIQPIMAYIQSVINVVTPLNLRENGVTKNSIKWEWDIVQNCEYELLDVDMNIIARLAINSITYTESDLIPETNYTRAIRSFDGVAYSPISQFITIPTAPAIDTETVRLITKRELDMSTDLRLISRDVPHTNLYKSGIGSGDDLLTSIVNDFKEICDVHIKIYAHDTQPSEIYKEKIFKYRIKKIKTINLADVEFGSIIGDVTTTDGTTIHIDQWARSLPTVIQFDELPDSEIYTWNKTGGHSNTNGIIYNNGLLIWALSGTIEVSDYVYSNWEAGHIDNNDRTVSVIIPDYDPTATYDVEFDIAHMIFDRSGDTITISTDDFVLLESNNVTLVYQDFIGTSVIGIDSITSFTYTIPNPRFIPDVSDKYLSMVLSDLGGNPNVDISTDFIINYVTGSDGSNITIPININVAIPSQTPWRLEVIPGYYYINAEEYYLFANNRVDNIGLGNKKFLCLSQPTMGTPILVIDEEGNSYHEVSNLDIEETVEVVNGKYIYTKYTGIDKNSVTLVGLNIEFDIINNIIILSQSIENVTIVIRYRVSKSFMITEASNGITIEIHNEDDYSHSEYNIYYDTDNKYIAKNININPLRNSRHSGFLYIGNGG